MSAPLTTARLVLAELAPADAPALQAFQADPAHCALQAVEPADFADAARRIHGYLAHRGPEDRRRIFAWTARDKASDAVIGTVSLQLSRPAIASLGFGVDHRRAGQGLAAEMARAAMAFGFGELKLHRLEADVAIENLACRRVLEKIGLRLEGVARECIFAQGRWWTEARYARLSSDPD